MTDKYERDHITSKLHRDLEEALNTLNNLSFSAKAFDHWDIQRLVEQARHSLLRAEYKFTEETGQKLDYMLGYTTVRDYEESGY